MQAIMSVPLQLAFIGVTLVAGGCGSAPSVERKSGRTGQATIDPASSQEPSLHDLSVSAERLLKGLPHVVSVTVPVPVERPSHRIIHVLDWHFVPKEAFAADLRDSAGGTVAEDDLHQSYTSHLDEVEAVQREQRELLRILVSRHGLRAVLQEGLTPLDLKAHRLLVEAEGNVAGKIAELMRSELVQYDATFAASLDALRAQHRLDLLRLGASGKLLIAGESLEVLPLDDESVHAAANPIAADGTFSLDEGAMEIREDAQVRRALAHGSCAVIVLGAAHDLADNVRRTAPGTCEYVRVRTTGCQDLVSFPD